MVKNPPAQEIQEAETRSLGREDPPEEETAAHPSTLTREIPGAGALQATAHGVAESDTAERVITHSTQALTEDTLQAEKQRRNT